MWELAGAPTKLNCISSIILKDVSLAVLRRKSCVGDDLFDKPASVELHLQGPHRLYALSGPGPIGGAQALGFTDGDIGGFKDVAPPAMARPSAIRTVIAADFDNDGYEELFFNNIGDANRLFRQVSNTPHNNY